MLLTLLLVGVVATSLWLGWRYKNRHLLKAAEQFAGPKPIPGIGNAMELICKPAEFIATIEKWMAENGDVLRFWLGPDLNILVANPDEAKTLLTNSKLSNKGPLYNYLRDYIGGGILSGSGPAWKKHRKIALPNYGRRAIQNYTQIFNQEVDQMIDELRKMPSDKEFNIYENVVKTTSYSVCQTLMGLTKEQTMSLPRVQDIIDGVEKMLDIAFTRMTTWYLQIDPVFWMTDSYKKQKELIQMIADFSKTTIEHRKEYLRNTGKEGKPEYLEMKEDASLSVIDRFILSGELSKEELLTETFTTFVSSQEAAAKIASYVLLMMAFHPDCQEKLYKELVEVIGDADRDLTEDDLKQMPYLEMVFKEVLRLYPPGAILQRTVSEDIAIKAGCLPAGCSLIVPIYFIQRDPRFWKNPNDFDPERFNPENSEKMHTNAYIPFSLGPMDCMGRYFAIQLVKIIAARVLREFELSSLHAYKDLQVSICISVAAIGGYPVLLKPRQKKEKIA